jgi:curved DNA-binding protein
MEDYYAILGITQSATQEEIKKKYRELAKQHHPDKNASRTPSVEFFKKIQSAYEILSDPAKRAAYDLQQKELTVSVRYQTSQSRSNTQGKSNGIITEAFRSAGMWVGFGLWVVSKLEKKINKD